MRRRLILVLVLLLPLSAGAGSATGTGNVLVLGDSLSAAYGMAAEQGWVAILAARLAQRTRPWRVVNTSVSGETTAGGAARLAGALERHSPAVVILELGANDGLRGLALKQTRANLERMLAQIRARRARVLLLGMRLPPNYGPVYTRRFQAIFDDLARDQELAYVPFFLEGVATNPDLMQADGLHPRASAQARLLDNIWTQLARILEPAAQ